MRAAAPKRDGWWLALVLAALMAAVGWLAFRPGTDLEWQFVPGTTVRISQSIYLRLRSTHSGFLYLLSDDQEKDTMNALGTFPVSANVQARIPGGDGFRFDQPAAVNVLCIWSRQKLPELERLARLFNSRDMGRVADSAERLRLRQLAATPPSGARSWSVRLTAH